MGNVALYNYVNKLHIEILYLWVNIVILLDSNNEIKKIGVTAPLIKIPRISLELHCHIQIRFYILTRSR